MPIFRAGTSATHAHQALKKCVEIINQTQQCAVLWFGEIMARQLYRELGYSTMRAYALEELGFSSTRAGDFMRLANRLASLPVVKEKVLSGELGYTQAREIIKVADKSNEVAWVKVAAESSREELAAVVKTSQKEALVKRKANSNQVEMVPRPISAAPVSAKPIRVGFELTPLQYARYETLLKKTIHRGSKAELLLDMIEALLGTENIAPRGATQAPHYQIHVHCCPECDRHTIATPQGDKILSSTEFAIVACDAQIAKPGQRNTTTIPPKTRRHVLARDRHRCRRKGCAHTRYLDIHHLVPRARGGTNKPENLVTLCTGCHHLWHDKGGDLLPLLRPIKPSSKT